MERERRKGRGSGKGSERKRQGRRRRSERERGESLREEDLRLREKGKQVVCRPLCAYGQRLCVPCVNRWRTGYLRVKLAVVGGGR